MPNLARACQETIPVSRSPFIPFDRSVQLKFKDSNTSNSGCEIVHTSADQSLTSGANLNADRLNKDCDHDLRLRTRPERSPTRQTHSSLSVRRRHLAMARMVRWFHGLSPVIRRSLSLVSPAAASTVLCARAWVGENGAEILSKQPPCQNVHHVRCAAPFGRLQWPVMTLRSGQ